MRYVLSVVFGLVAAMASAGPRDAVFTNIDGGQHRFSAWAGQPVLVVNTASECGFTGQYAGLPALQDRYDFQQEFDSAAEVKAFCEVTFGLDLPMTDITDVKGPDAHPFYKAARAETGFVPKWNFNKVLIAPDGRVAGTWGAQVIPGSRAITRAIEPLLNVNRP